MKFCFVLKGIDFFLNSIIKEDIKDRRVRNKIKIEYRAIIERASDIGTRNNLLTSYGLAAYFIAMNRCDGLTADKNIEILDRRMRSSKALKVFMGNAQGYFSDKKMAFRRDWSKRTYQRKYKNDWLVDVLEKSDDYQFGFNYKECGVCKLCNDEGCPELAKYLCRLDFMLVEVIGIKLIRTQTLAEGADYCDFRFCK